AMEAEEDVALSGPTVHGQDTLPRLFRHVVQQRGDAVAMREKDLGVWRAVTWRDYGERARRVGLGLVALGLRPRDVVSILAENGPEWLYTDLGTMSVGGVTNGIYTTDAPRQVEYIVNDSGTRFFFAGDEEQLDKILEVRARCPGLVTIVVFDVEGLHGFTDPQVTSFGDLLDLGARYEHEHPGAWDPLVEIARPDDLAILVYTSGTTGPPKGAMLSHRNIIFQLGFTDYLTPPREGDQQLSFLPLSHVAERTFTVFYPLSTGSTVTFAESIDTVKRSMGLPRVRGAATGAAPIAPELIKWYMALGIDTREVYGQTENCGLATAMPADRIKLGTVGVARPGTEIRLSPQGEILLKGPHVFLGYYKNPERTAQTVIDGWLHTGDVGRMDAEGFVTITDRMKDIIITAGGKNVTPSEIENQLKFSPYISDAVVIGDQRKYLSCLVMIDHETVAQFAQEKNVPFTNFASLCRAKEVQDLIWSEIERVNKQLARVETIKKFRLIEQLLTAEDEELTPTMKLKRTFVNRKYKDVIDGMYVEM